MWISRRHVEIRLRSESRDSKGSWNCRLNVTIFLDYLSGLKDFFIVNGIWLCILDPPPPGATGSTGCSGIAGASSCCTGCSGATGCSGVTGRSGCAGATGCEGCTFAGCSGTAGGCSASDRWAPALGTSCSDVQRHSLLPASTAHYCSVALVSSSWVLAAWWN